jgi:hypothetical protein
MIKTNSMRQRRYVAWIGNTRHRNNFLLENNEERNHLEDLGLDGG